MVKQFVIAALSLAPVLMPAPAMAQNAAQNGVLVIYGNDKCPTDTDGNEIVVCARRPEAERFRIPKELRELEVTPENKAWAARVGDVTDAGATGIGSCSTVGPGGGTGCFVRGANAANAEARQRTQQESEIIEPE